jgi:chitinase
MLLTGILLTVLSSNFIRSYAFAVIGYMPEYRLGSNYNYEEAFKNGLTHVIFFSLEVSTTEFTPSALDRLPPPDILKQARAAADAYGGKLLLCFGGNSRTGGFPGMVVDKTRRHRFLTALSDLLVSHSFDGVDYNWEYPTKYVEWEGLAELMKETKALLNGQAIVTSAFYPDPNQYTIIKTLRLHEICHYLLSMTYDMVPGKHSTYEFAVQTIESWKQQGLPLDRLALGVPFYGRHIHTGAPETYYDLFPKLEKRYKDLSKRHAADELGAIYFNGRSILQQKAELAIREGLGGLMIWELGQDISPPSHDSALMSGLGEVVVKISASQRSSGGGASLPVADLVDDLNSDLGTAATADKAEL